MDAAVRSARDSEAKEYGTSKVAEGGPVNGRRVVLIEDGAIWKPP
ncbi:hypothetical protein SAMN05216284_12350 [Micromonospora sediminimaris]|nr:hypothetical protein SAMN05216284_12350 [Micromonospora sediminimaris]